MFTFPNPQLKPGPASNLLDQFGIRTFHDAVDWIWKLPYGRTSDRSDYMLVPVERKGACSAKHAFLARVALEQSIPLALTIGIFMMDQKNTPGIGTILKDHGIQSIPEAHCLLQYRSLFYDFTSYAESTEPHPRLDFVHYEKIAPSQIGTYKTELHKHWLGLWARQTNQKLSLEKLWAIRESCIEALASNSLPDSLGQTEGDVTT